MIKLLAPVERNFTGAEPSTICSDRHKNPSAFTCRCTLRKAPSACCTQGRAGAGDSFSPLEEQLILTLSNHAATVIARQELAAQAAQAAALKEADTLKDALLSLVSHELRSPWRRSRRQRRTSDARTPPSTTRRVTRPWPQSTSNRIRLTRLVSNLLDLSRLEAGAWRPQKDWCDMTDVVATVLDQTWSLLRPTEWRLTSPPTYR